MNPKNNFGYIFNKSKTFEFIIASSPEFSNIIQYKKTLAEHNIDTIVRASDKSYDESLFEPISVIDMQIEDGNNPSNVILEKWLALIKTMMGNNKKGVMVHCAAGLGRSPLLVCMALICFDHNDPHDTIYKIRESVPKAFNHTQLKYIENINKNIVFRKYNKKSDKCAIM